LENKNRPPLIERERIPWILGLAAIGVIASFFVSRTNQSRSNQDFRLGQIETVKGSVFLIESGSEQKKSISKTAYLKPLDSVETGENSEASLHLENTASLRMKADTLLTLERHDVEDNFQDVLVLQRGEIQVEDPGRDGEFFISKNGQRISAAAYNQSSLAKDPMTPRASQLPPEEKSDLSDAEITTLMTAQGGNFRRCYQNLLQKEPQAKGEASLNFTIENNGRIGLIEITSVALKSEEFKRCLTSVLERVQFRAFSGTSISTFYPVKFE
jgi:hypothetical protein